jgi:hypothetical protein
MHIHIYVYTNKFVGYATLPDFITDIIVQKLVHSVKCNNGQLALNQYIVPSAGRFRYRYVCTHACIYIHIYIYTYMYTYIFRYIFIHICIYIYMLIY